LAIPGPPCRSKRPTWSSTAWFLEMAESGFLPNTRRLLRRLPPISPKIPQTSLPRLEAHHGPSVRSLLGVIAGYKIWALHTRRPMEDAARSYSWRGPAECLMISGALIRFSTMNLEGVLTPPIDVHAGHETWFLSWRPSRPASQKARRESSGRLLLSGPRPPARCGPFSAGERASNLLGHLQSAEGTKHGIFSTSDRLLGGSYLPVAQPSSGSATQHFFCAFNLEQGPSLPADHAKRDRFRAVRVR